MAVAGVDAIVNTLSFPLRDVRAVVYTTGVARVAIIHCCCYRKVIPFPIGQFGADAMIWVGRSRQSGRINRRIADVDRCRICTISVVEIQSRVIPMVVDTVFVRGVVVVVGVGVVD